MASRYILALERNKSGFMRRRPAYSASTHSGRFIISSLTNNLDNVYE